MATVLLQCVKQGSSRLRIRFVRFIDSEGNHSTNVYRNDLNCRFPKEGRVESHYYQVPHEDVSLVFKGCALSHYSVKKSNIKYLGPTLSEEFNSPKSEKPVEVYSAEECVICLEDKPNTVFGPCGHMCMCENCYKQMLSRAAKKDCPLCRRKIVDVFMEDNN